MMQELVMCVIEVCVCLCVIYGMRRIQGKPLTVEEGFHFLAGASVMYVSLHR